jgi:NADP-dependent aldehyde dehydrogenase
MTTTETVDLDRVLTGAAAAKSAFAQQDPRQRYTQLAAVAARLDDAADDLVELAITESHLPEPRLRGELRRTTMQLRLFAEEALSGTFFDARIDRRDPEFGSGPRSDIRRMRVPIGVVLNFAASNFPFAFSVAGGDTASALATGCPVVVKAHPGHPRLSALTAAIVTEALAGTGAPAGSFALIEGQDNGIAALRDDRVDAATFTGSVRGGLYLEKIARDRDRPIPFYGELGSINPVFVTAAAAGARGPQIAAGFVGSYTLGNGQFCTKPGLLFLPAGHGLERDIAAAAGEVTSGRLLTESITAGFRDRLSSLSAEVDGAMVLASADRDGCPQPGLMQIDVDTFVRHADNVRTEAFGPFSVIVEYTDVAQLLTAVEHLEGSLTASLQAEASDGDLVRALLPALQAKAGRVLVNDWPTGVAVTPAQQHGGPYPSTTSVLHTSVGTAAVDRFLRPVAYQNFPQEWLPAPLQDANPWQVPQRIGEPGLSGKWGRSAADGH